jgi:hypothetical protein
MRIPNKLSKEGHTVFTIKWGFKKWMKNISEFMT